jgi:hypothetical protein
VSLVGAKWQARRFNGHNAAACGEAAAGELNYGNSGGNNQLYLIGRG